MKKQKIKNKEHEKPNNKEFKSNLIIVAITLAITLIIIFYATFAQKLAWPLFPLGNIIGDENYNNASKKNKNSKNSKPNSKPDSDSGSSSWWVFWKDKNPEPSINPGNNTNVDWDVGFTSASVISKVGLAFEKTPVSYNDNSASFHVMFVDKTDKIIYQFTIKNKGIIDAKVESIYVIPDNSPSNPVVYNIKGVAVGDELLVGDTKNIEVTVSPNTSYNYSGSETRTAKIIINYVQK